jgi:hypothetical protein
MPERMRVRVTRTSPTSAPTLAVARSTRDFKDDAREQVFRAPNGPACCMYNGCFEETIPYLPVAAPRSAQHVMLAVWPETAEVSLVPRPRPQERGEAPNAACLGARARVEQLVRAGQHGLASGREPSNCWSCAKLWRDDGHGFEVELSSPADGYNILATSDADGDGQPEAIVYENWRNDYGLDVLAVDPPNVVYHFSCGNI